MKVLSRVLSCTSASQMLLISRMWRLLLFFNFLKILDMKNFTNISIVGLCRKTPKNCKFCLQIWLPRPCSSEIWRFLWFWKLKFRIFSQNLKFPTLYLVTAKVLPGVAFLVFRYHCSILCTFPDNAFLTLFQKIVFRALKLEVSPNCKFPPLYLGTVWVLSGVANLVQLVLVFEMRRFYKILNFSNELRYKKLHKVLWFFKIWRKIIAQNLKLLTL